MSCGGCSGAVERVLKKLEGMFTYSMRAVLTARQGLTRDFSGVKSYDVSLESQTATVLADDSLGYERVLEAIKKTGKTVNSGEADGTPQTV